MSATHISIYFPEAEFKEMLQVHANVKGCSLSSLIVEALEKQFKEIYDGCERDRGSNSDATTSGISIEGKLRDPAYGREDREETLSHYEQS